MVLLEALSSLSFCGPWLSSCLSFLLSWLPFLHRCPQAMRGHWHSWLQLSPAGEWLQISISSTDSAPEGPTRHCHLKSYQNHKPNMFKAWPLPFSSSNTCSSPSCHWPVTYAVRLRTPLPLCLIRLRSWAHKELQHHLLQKALLKLYCLLPPDRVRCALLYPQDLCF